MLIINPKSIARLAAVQVLYHYAITGEVEGVKQWIIGYYKDPCAFLDDLEVSENYKFRLPKQYYLELVQCTLENLVDIDVMIESYMTMNRSITDLPIILLCLLRVGASELSYFPQIPHIVTIDEFTNLAASLGFSTEVNFINSILENINRSLNLSYARSE